jgi:hypothetical protein
MHPSLKSKGIAVLKGIRWSTFQFAKLLSPAIQRLAPHFSSIVGTATLAIVFKRFKIPFF